MNIFDFHVHAFPDKIAHGAVSKLAAISGLVPQTDGTLSDTLTVMEKCSIDMAAILNIAATPKQESSVNLSAVSIMNENKGKLFPFGSVHFQSENSLAELENIKKSGLFGVKLHPDYQGFMIDDERLFPIYDLCAELSLPILFHAGYDCYSPDLVHAPPAKSAEVIKRFPKLKVILAHFGGLNRWNEVEEYIIGKNVWLDTAMCATYADQEQIKGLILKHDSEKVLFGSDCPWECPSSSVSFIEKMNFDDKKNEDIFFSNAKKLLSF